MSDSDTGRRLLLVHAHPDDESIATGGIMAKYAAQGAHVTLVTCTLGELGEVIPAELDHLRAERDDRLGPHRIGELAAACAALGVTDHRFLGGPGRWRDSGMMGTPGNDWPGCFWRADVDEAAAELTEVLREVRPQVIVTYDANGFYGHPDHIQAHRVAWRAFEQAKGQPWEVSKFYAHTIGKRALAQSAATVRAADTGFSPPPDPQQPAAPAADVAAGGRAEAAGGRAEAASGRAEAASGRAEAASSRAEAASGRAEAASGRAEADCQAPGNIAMPPGVPDEQVTTEIDIGGYLAAKLTAMAAHATQISVNPPFFALSDNVGRLAGDREYFMLLAGLAGPGSGPSGREDDLFAGLPLAG